MHPYLLLSLALATTLSAQEIKLWPQGAPGSEGHTSAEVVETASNGERKITNIHFPSITPFLAPAEKATGAAVIVVPGGGHKNLCITHEGDNVAHWLADHGITAFVLKNRLASEPNSPYTVDGHAVPDLQRALRLVRSRASEWKVSPAALGVMGFSAGGELYYMATQTSDAGHAESPDPIEHLSSRPDFQMLIYPGRSQRMAPAAGQPPTFLAASANDREDIAEGLANVYLLYKKAHVPVELHLYASGGHGFGLRPEKEKPTPVDGWINRGLEWLIDRGFSKP